MKEKIVCVFIIYIWTHDRKRGFLVAEHQNKKIQIFDTLKLQGANCELKTL